MEETQPQVTGGNKMPLIIVGVVVVLALGAFVGMKVMNKSTEPAANDQMMMNNNESMTGTTTTPSAAPSEVMAADTSAVKEITMDAGSFYYSVKTIEVKKGQKVKITMTSKDMMHDFNIDELNVHMPDVKSGETDSIEFTADKVGTFEYYCSVGQHRKMGQVGKIIVTE